MINSNYPQKWDIRDRMRLARTLFQINGNDDYNFIDWLKYELSEMDRRNREEKDIEILRRRQGAALLIETMLSMLATADDTYRKFNEQLELQQRNQEHGRRFDYSSVPGR